MRFLKFARLVIHTERAEKASPPRRSLTFVLSWDLGRWESCGCDSDGGGAVDEDCDGWVGFWSELVFSGRFAAVESGLELEPQPK